MAHPLLKALKRPQGLIEMGRAYGSGSPITQTADNVRFLNSLQVSFSEQYVFCEKDNFSLINEMINDSETYKTGPRMTVN